MAPIVSNDTTTDTTPRHDMAQTIDVLEAARRLGITPDAVRARLRRGTLEGYRDNSGNWRIVSDDTTTDTTPEAPRHDADTTRHDSVSPELARRPDCAPCGR